MSREAMKQALDYRTRYDRGCYKCGSHYCPADCPDPTHLVPQQPLCTSPPKTEQEPVAWMYVNKDGECEQIEYGPVLDDPDVTPLYTAPPKKQWVGLTDEEVSDAIDDVLEGGGWLDVARALESAIKKKNT